MEQRIQAVEPGSIAKELGLEAGDVILSINGQPVLDLVDFLHFSAQEELVLRVKPRDGSSPVTVELEKDAYEPLGLSFDRPLMSPTRVCGNRCLFCFVDQLPKGVRSSLKFKDDDWRMSLMMGNYVTLTNVDEAELTRIRDRKVSPLYLSVHAVDLKLRRMLLGNPKAPDIVSQMRFLAGAGLKFHTQIVLCPGYNDGAALDETLSTLFDLKDACLSVAVVPVGLTAYRRIPFREVAPMDAQAALRIIGNWQQKAMAALGQPFVFASDELYLRAGLELPPASHYGDYPQIENGVGMWRLFETAFDEARLRHPRAATLPVRLITGMSAAPLMRGLVEALPGEARVVPLENRFFGPSITVSGLLTGCELMDLAGEDTPILIPRSMLRETEDIFLDDMPLEQIGKILGVPVLPVDVEGDKLFNALCGIKEDEG